MKKNKGNTYESSFLCHDLFLHLWHFLM